MNMLNSPTVAKHSTPDEISPTVAKHIQPRMKSRRLLQNIHSANEIDFKPQNEFGFHSPMKLLLDMAR